MKQYKKFVFSTIFQSFFILIILALPIIIVDPYFHYHKPLKSLFYSLHNQRSQNDGITKHFEYDAIITGSSMTDNFKTTMANKLFNAEFIKLPYAGGSFKEINDNLNIAFEHNKNLKIVIRSIDKYAIEENKNAMNTTFGKHPTYLYDKNLINDVFYIFNREILFYEVIPLLKRSLKEKQKGVTDFDHYSYWMHDATFGKTVVLANRTEFKKPVRIYSLTEEQISTISENITQNITSLAKENPQCQFYYFSPPYSAAWWGKTYESGNLKRQIDIERLVIEQILQYENIKLYSFNNEYDITTNLNNYKDSNDRYGCHYGEWINSLMLEYMTQDKCLLTKDNYLDYLEKEKEFYSTFDYNSLFDQIDEEDRPCDLQ